MVEKEDPLFKIFPFTQFDQYLAGSSISDYLKEYLEHISAKTCICEYNYIDKDYMIDFSKFYARSYENIPKITDRYHFFKESITEEEFLANLNQKDESFLKSLNGSYLGFIVVKKNIKDLYGKYLFGRILLETYEKEDNGENRVFLKHPYKVNLFGIKLEIETLPFQQQDIAVGAYATVACWISHFPLQKLFNIQSYSPAEITEKALLCPSDCRNFPSEGLTKEQMKAVFNCMGMDTEFIRTDIDRLGLYKDEDDIIADAVKAFINYELPIIACLTDKNNDESHAVVISGYRHNNGNIVELYVHDDNIGPYHHIKPDSKFKLWKDSHPKDGDIDWEVESLFVPIYPKIRLVFSRIYGEFLKEKRNLEHDKLIKAAEEDLIVELLLTDVKKYKTFIFDQPFEGKKEILTRSFPRFLWIIRKKVGDIVYSDKIYDGTAVFPEPILEVEYITNSS